MNSLPKFIASTALTDADWNNTQILSGDIPTEVSALKDQSGDDLAVFGSSRLTVSLLKTELVDEIRIIVNPVLLGDGRTLFEGLTADVELQLVDTKQFANGNLLLRYRLQYS